MFEKAIEVLRLIEKKGFKVVTSRTDIPNAPNERLATLELT